jgi:hypothetical protein
MPTGLLYLPADGVVAGPTDRLPQLITVLFVHRQFDPFERGARLAVQRGVAHVARDAQACNTHSKSSFKYTIHKT